MRALTKPISRGRIQIEVQGQPDRGFAQRMFVYHYRVFDRYKRSIMSIAVLADEQENWGPERFTQELCCCTIELRYPVVKLLDWRERDAELAASQNPFALVVQAHLAALATRNARDARVQAKIGLIRGLFARGYERMQILGSASDGNGAAHLTRAATIDYYVHARSSQLGSRQGTARRALDGHPAGRG